MFEKNMKMAYLLDFYEGLLDRHTSEIMKLYYNDDLSLAEIASGAGISRQGIRHLIKKGEEQLSFFDEKLRLADRYAELESVGSELAKIKRTLSDIGGHEREIESLDRIMGIIMKGN